MFTKVVGQLSGMEGLPEDSVTLLQDVFGNCQQPLTHYGPVEIAPTTPPGATLAGLTVANYKQNGGEGAYNLAIRAYGGIDVIGNYKTNGIKNPQMFPGAVTMFAGTAAQLAVYLLNGWAIADGTAGTVDLSGKYLRASGGGYTQGDSAGSLTTSAASGNTGSSTTGITVSNHSASNTGNTQVSVIIVDPGHTHVIQVTTANFTAGAVPAITAVFSPSDVGYAGITTGGETAPGHSHTTPSYTHTVNESSHTHTLGSHTHTAEPPYYIVTVLMFVG